MFEQFTAFFLCFQVLWKNEKLLYIASFIYKHLMRIVALNNIYILYFPDKMQWIPNKTFENKFKKFSCLHLSFSAESWKWGKNLDTLSLSNYINA